MRPVYTRKLTVSTVNASTYNVQPADDVLHVTYTSTGACSIDLKTAQLTTGRWIIVKDAGGNADTNNITITTEGSETIDGSATYVMATKYQTINIYCDGSNYFVY